MVIFRNFIADLDLGTYAMLFAMVIYPFVKNFLAAALLDIFQPDQRATPTSITWNISSAFNCLVDCFPFGLKTLFNPFIK